MTALKIVALAVGLCALLLTFKSKYIIENLLHKEASEGMVLRVKCVALALAIAAFISVFIFI